MIYLIGSHPQKKMDSPTPGSHQLSVAPQLGVGLMSPPLFHSCLLIGPMLCSSCMGNRSGQELMSAVTPLRPQDVVSVWSSMALTLKSLFPFPEMSSELRGRRCAIDILFMTEDCVA